jgi:hypothetical protein
MDYIIGGKVEQRDYIAVRREQQVDHVQEDG